MTIPRTRSILKKDDSDLELSTSSKTTALSSDSSEDGERERPFNPIHVKFDSIQVRDYDITLGDNPSCSFGPPLSLDWDYDENEPVCIDKYEEGRHPRRKMYQMHMLSRQRANLLKREAGTTDDEMEKIMDEMRKIQKGRNMTKAGLPFSKIHEAAESATRKWNRRKESPKRVIE
jgi:hypothetical protein